MEMGNKVKNRRRKGRREGGKYGEPYLGRDSVTSHAPVWLAR